MASRRCSLCGISYPGDWKFNNCPLHGERTDYVEHGKPDADWEYQLLRLVEWLEGSAVEPPDIPQIETRVVVRGGEFFVHAWDVYPAVRRIMREGDLIQIGKQTFEILAYIFKQREYLIRPFSLTLSDDDLVELARP